MGEKKVSIRTLDSGEQVRHEPPDEDHPDGKMTLIPGQSALRERLEDSAEDKRERLAELANRQRNRLRSKQESLKAHPEVPGSKRHV